MGIIRKVVIIGGGIGGLTLGIALKKRGIPFTIHEKYDHFQRHQTGFLIWSYAIRVLRDLDVPVENAGAILETFELHDAHDDTVMEMPIGEVSREHGANSYEMNRRRLTETLAAMVGDALVMNHACEKVETVGERAIATFADGSTDEGDIVIGCDGAHSRVRQMLHPHVGIDLLPSGGWIAVLDKHPPGLQPNRHIDFWQPGFKAGVADIGHGEARWYLAMADRIADPTRPVAAQIKSLMEHVPPLLQACLEATDPSRYVTTQAGDLLGLDPWYRNRILLIGDAAHATSPYAGMGACTAIADAKCLADMIACATDIPTMCRAFQAQRKPIVDAVIKESRGSLHTSTSRSKLRNWLRDFSLRHIPEKTMHKVCTDMVTGK